MQEQLDELPHEGRKRKQSASPMQDQPPPSSSQGYQQSTITDHFSRSESPSSKRSKADSADPMEISVAPLISPVKQSTISKCGTFTRPMDLTRAPFVDEAEIECRRMGKPPPFRTQPVVKKIPVKNLRTATNDNYMRYYDTMWKTLDGVLTTIFETQKVTTSMEVLYRGVENICRSDLEPKLYEALKGRLEGYIRDQLKPQILARMNNNGIETAQVVVAGWKQWEGQMRIIRSIFLYLNRSYLLQTPHVKTVEQTGNELFRRYIAADCNVEPSMLNGVLSLFEQDRNCRGTPSPNVDLLVACIKMINELGLYAKIFEPRYLVVSREYYSQLAQRESESRTLVGYLKECVDIMDNERDRGIRFALSESTKRDLVLIVEDEMIKKKLPMLTDTDRVRELLDRMDFESLSTLLDLTGRVGNAGELLKIAWESYIIAEGTKIVTDMVRVKDMVPRLLDFKGNLDSMVAGPFKGNGLMSYSLRESFQKFINERRTENVGFNNSKPAEMIAKYVDQLLQSGTKGLPPVAGRSRPDDGNDDAELSYRLELVLELFRFIQGKDVFEAFYKNALSKRLLMKRSASYDAERLMLAKLKNECGSAFTHNLENMFKDMDLSKESIASFKTSKTGIEKAKNVDLDVQILSQAAWPTYPEISVNIPHDLVQCLEAFGQFYLSKHSGRKLTWRHNMAHCTVKADFPMGAKELIMGAFQTVVLLAFNDAPENGVLTYRDIQQASGLPDEELKRTLQSLALGKARILKKSPKDREVTPNDKFQVNQSFTDPKFRVKVNQIQLKETKKEQTETHERVARDRQYETQAAIIRIMKSRKKIRHVDLVQQAIDQTKYRGTLDVGAIKENIERLIEKDYMDRDGDDHYVYVA
ncbi:Cullin family-domain-containing protein [Geopyxis carbonaria]|nr:Cullin family-domain-containing protein [Geopyxis carbonaria]